MIRAAIALLVALVSPAVSAATFGLHLVTAHFGSSDVPLHSETPGIYFRADNGFTAGVYRNSYGRTSTYAAWTIETEDRRFALTAGAVTGYGAARVMPLIAPSARLPLTQNVAARIVFIPKPVHHGHAAGLHLALEYSF